MLAFFALAIPGCTSTHRVPVERTEPAQVDLPTDVRRLGVHPFSGPSGLELATQLTARLGGAGREVVWVAAPVRPNQAREELLHRIASEGLDALLTGEVELLEGPDGGPDAAAPGGEPGLARIRVRFRIVLRDGGELPAPALAIAATAEEYRREDAGWAGLLVRRAAERVAASLTLRAVPGEVVWEGAGGWDDEALAHFTGGDYAAARRALERAIVLAQAAGATDDILGALYYDLALCQELLGAFRAAERSYDEALTLAGSELHIEALRAFRARLERLGGEGR